MVRTLFIARLAASQVKAAKRVSIFRPGSGSSTLSRVEYGVQTRSSPGHCIRRTAVCRLIAERIAGDAPQLARQ